MVSYKEHVVWILMLTIWTLLLLIAAIYIVRVILLARYVKRQMNGNLDTMSYISNVINSTLSPGGVFAIISGSVTRKIKQQSKD